MKSIPKTKKKTMTEVMITDFAIIAPSKIIYLDIQTHFNCGSETASIEQDSV